MDVHTTHALEVLTLVSLAGILYAYLGFPLLLRALVAVKRWCQPARRPEPFEPFVSVIITAHNEARCIAETVRACLAQTYPQDRYEIIVCSDACTDGTERIVESLGSSLVRTVITPNRQGKRRAQEGGVQRARGQVLVFLDANTILQPPALAELVDCFSDPAVGCATGQLQYVSPTDGRPRGESLYWRYENWLRGLESELGTVIVVAGGIYALRPGLYIPDLPAAVTADLAEPVSILLRGFKCVYRPSAGAVETYEPCPAEEFRRKVRVIARGMGAMSVVRPALNPLRYPLLSWVLLSHKCARWAVPLAMALILVATGLAWPSLWAQGVLFLQTIFYGAASLALLLQRWRLRVPALSIALYFTAMNLASLIALVWFLRYRGVATWQPVGRVPQPVEPRIRRAY